MPDIQGVILIDVWQDYRLRPFYQDVVNRLKNFNIKCCVNASYNLDITSIKNFSDRSLHNTFRLHFWNRNPEYQNTEHQNTEYQNSQIEPMHPSDKLIYNVVRFSRSNYHTDSILHTSDLLGSDASIVILDTDDLIHHCQMYHNNSIKNWLIVGQSWMMCVHFRPMGLYRLAELVTKHDYNFFVTPWSVRDQCGVEIDDQCFQGSDGLSWEPVDNFGYRLAV